MLNIPKPVRTSHYFQENETSGWKPNFSRAVACDKLLGLWQTILHHLQGQNQGINNMEFGACTKMIKTLPWKQFHHATIVLSPFIPLPASHFHFLKQFQPSGNLQQRYAASHPANMTITWFNLLFHRSI